MMNMGYIVRSTETLKKVAEPLKILSKRRNYYMVILLYSFLSLNSFAIKYIRDI